MKPTHYYVTSPDWSERDSCERCRYCIALVLCKKHEFLCEPRGTCEDWKKKEKE